MQITAHYICHIQIICHVHERYLIRCCEQVCRYIGNLCWTRVAPAVFHAVHQQLNSKQHPHLGPEATLRENRNGF